MTIDTPLNKVEKAMANRVKKTKTPRNYDSILKGALALDLPERVNLKNELIKSIKKEVDDLQQQAAEAANIAKE